MKRMFVFLLFVCACTSTFNVVAQEETPKESRKEIREKKRAEAKAKLIKNISEKNFTFTAFSMKPNMGASRYLSSQYNFFSVHPNYIEALLPFQTTSSVPGNPSYVDFEVSDYEYTVDESTEGKLIIKLIIKNAVNQSAFSGGLSSNMNYEIKIEVMLESSSAILTLTPDFYSPVTYNGYIKNLE